jgi:hypothetical protein
MTNQELDKAIAEIRGERCMYYSLVPLEFGKDGPACHKNSIAFPDACRREGTSYCLSYENKPYSSNIRYAFELWDKMKEAGLCPCLSTIDLDGNTNPCCSITIPSQLIIQESKAETEARAIAECFYKWRSDE